MRIVWTSPALADVRGIDDWLSKEATRSIALRTLGAIGSRAHFLEDFPRGGRPFGKEQRVLRVYDTPYVIRYRIIDEEVQIIRVHHEREDWQLEP
jgi:toxin ParE1/3/4